MDAAPICWTGSGRSVTSAALLGIAAILVLQTLALAPTAPVDPKRLHTARYQQQQQQQQQQPQQPQQRSPAQTHGGPPQRSSMLPATPPATPAESAFLQDSWIRKWISTGNGHSPAAAVDLPLAEADCPRMPHYIAPRDPPPPGKPTAHALIPRIIFQTWKTHRMSRHMRSAAQSWVRLNPEYHYALFDDFDCEAFVRDHFNSTWGDTGFHTYRLYTSLKSGTARADVWRLLVVWKYGGAYLPSGLYSAYSLCLGPMKKC
jgi:hypothetical protein